MAEGRASGSIGQVVNWASVGAANWANGRFVNWARERLGKASLLVLPSPLNQDSADISGVVLFSSEPGEFIRIDAHVVEDLT